MSTKTSISVVVPMYNEEGNVAELHKEIVDVCTANNYEYEIIFVDDGSTDRTQEICKELSPLTYIRLRRNFGQTAAMDAGIKQAKNAYIVTMDGDLQNDPADIPLLIKELEITKKDVISGWRRKRKDDFIKRFVSRGAHLLRRMMIHDGIHDSGCSLKIYRRECFENVSLYGEMHRFIPALLKIKGFTIGEIEVNHRPRIDGYTKYTWKRSIKGFLDMLSVWFWNKYAVRPLHLLGSLGIGCGLFGVATSVVGISFYIAGITLFKNILPVIAIFFLLSGIQLFVFGLMADMLSKSYFSVTSDNSYSVAEIYHNHWTNL